MLSGSQLNMHKPGLIVAIRTLKIDLGAQKYRRNGETVAICHLSLFPDYILLTKRENSCSCQPGASLLQV